MFLALREFDQDHVKLLRHCLSVVMLPKAEMVGWWNPQSHHRKPDGREGTGLSEKRV